MATLILVSCGKKGGKNNTTKLETFEQKISYAVGYDVTRSLKQMDVKLDKDIMYQGIIDALNDSSTKPMMSNEEMELVFQELKQRNMKAMQQQMSDMAGPNRSKGQEYASKAMAENPAMKKTPSGLIYLEVKPGKGAKPGPESTVDVKYTGMLIDGTIFDQTKETPATFKVNQVIPGWTEGLQLMSEGAVYKLIIPAELAYGNNPPPQSPIQPGSTLVFEVELLKIK